MKIFYGTLLHTIIIAVFNPSVDNNTMLRCSRFEKCVEFIVLNLEMQLLKNQF